MRFRSRVGEYFEVRRGFRQGCVMSSLLFNISFDTVVRLVNEKETGRRVKLRYEKGEGWEIKQLLYANDTLLVT